MTLLLFVACSSDNDAEDVTGNQYAITFSSTLSVDKDGNKQSTRAGTSQPLYETGVTDFIVYGIKGQTSGTFTSQDVVFPNYKGVWSSNTANTTSTNSSGWEYFGIDGSDQMIKYWDYGQDTYYFWAIAKAANGKYTAKGSGASAPQAADGYATFDDQGRVTTYTKAVSTSENLSESGAFYYSNICKVEKANFGKTVNLQFIPYLSRVRVAFYENITGYVVSDLVITSANISYVKSGTAVLTYNYTDDKITSTITPSETEPSIKEKLGDIQYPTLIRTEDDPDLTEGSAYENVENKYLGRSSNRASYALGDGAAKGYYINLLPYENRNTSFTITCNYTITNTATGVSMVQKDVEATVPDTYLNWRPGFAYTYIFKISEIPTAMSFVQMNEVAIKSWVVEPETDHPVYNW